jgi:hypothetical protein
MQFVIDSHDGNSICILEGLTEEECDVARNMSNTHTALSAGAFSVGTTYKREEEEEFRAIVRADNDETAREAAEKYYEAIQEELEDET